MINPNNIMLTSGVMAMCGKGFDDGAKEDYLFRPCLSKIVREQFEKEPVTCLDGGNDQEFFTVEFRSQKLFVARNEIDGLTVMLPSEY